MKTESLLERFIIDELLLGDAPQKLDPDQSLISSNLLDSLALLRLIAFIEEQFGVEIHDGEVIPNNFQTINHMKVLIENKRSPQS
jgi:acyl carrier protein